MYRQLRPIVAVVSLVAALTGCFHTTVETGLAPGPQIISQPWAHGFLYGLVPPSPLSTAPCKYGVSRVESQMSFVNGVAAVLTSGLYTPLRVDITCSAASPASVPLSGGPHYADDVGAGDKVRASASKH